MNPSDENLVSLCVTEDMVHEALITTALEEAEIQFVVQDYHDEAYDGLYQMTHGHSRILVLEQDFSAAEELVSHIPNPKNEQGELAE